MGPGTWLSINRLPYQHRDLSLDLSTCVKATHGCTSNFGAGEKQRQRDLQGSLTSHLPSLWAPDLMRKLISKTKMHQQLMKRCNVNPGLHTATQIHMHTQTKLILIYWWHFNGFIKVWLRFNKSQTLKHNLMNFLGYMNLGNHHHKQDSEHF